MSLTRARRFSQYHHSVVSGFNATAAASGFQRFAIAELAVRISAARQRRRAPYLGYARLSGG